MTDTLDETPRSASDERGAIMALGLFLALAVVAAIWCVIGIGNAVLEQEMSQEAADSAAYANAVVHARGMNLIAFINMLMLAMTMVYLALSWLDMLLSTLILITGVWGVGPNHCIIRYLTWLADIPIQWCTVASRLQKVERPIYRADERLFETIKKVGPPLFEMQVWAAQIVPHLGTSAALLTATEYGRSLTLSVSLSSYPGGGAIHPLHKLFLLDKIPALDRKRPDPEKPVTNLLQDRRIGLPVEGEPASQLCISSARLPMELFLYGLGKAPASSDLAKLLSTEPMNSMIATFNQATGEVNKAFFCQSKMVGHLPKHMKWASGKDLIGELLHTLGGAILYANNALMHETFRFGMLGVDTNDKFYLKGDYFWKMNWPSPMARKGSAFDDGYSAGPKRVVNYAYNGSDWMQVWAWTFARREGDTEASRVVATPARLFGRSPAAVLPAAERDANMPFRLFVAQAEFYFDCSGMWQAGQCNRGGAAMYQMRWRARLRRVHGLNYLADLAELTFVNLIHNPLLRESLGRFAHPFAAAGINTVQNLVRNLFNHEVLQKDGTSDAVLH